MSTSITIGNAFPKFAEWKLTDREPPTLLKWEVEEVSQYSLGAPTAQSRSSTCCISSGYLTDFVQKAGLSAMFWGTKQGLMYEWHDDSLGYQDNIVALTVRHADELDRALNTWRIQYPDIKPKNANAESVTEAEHILAKLEWFAFWVRWAVNNCRHPALEWQR